MKLIRALALTLLVSSLALAQNAALMPMPKLQFFSSQGKPLAGGLIYTYAAGTSTPLATYTDSTGGTPLPNPVPLDSGGSASIWLGSAAYKIVAENYAGVVQWTVDNVTNSGIAIAGSLSGPTGATLVGYQAAGTGAATRTVAAKLGETRSVMDFGAAGDGATDDRTAIQAGLTAVSPSCGTLLFPAGHTFLVGSNPGGTSLLTYPPCVSMLGPGTIKVGNSLGSFDAIFRASGSTVGPASIRNLTFDLNGANNVIASAPGTTNRQNVFYFNTGGYDGGGSGLVIEGNRFLNGHSVWTLESNSPNVTVRGNLWDNWGIGVTATFYDSSLLYLDGDGAAVIGNTFSGAGMEAKTAIEIHRSNHVVSGNVIKGFYAGVIFSADEVSTGTASNIEIIGNTVNGAMNPIQFWSTDGYVQNLNISGNVLTVDRNTTAWAAGLGGIESGICWYANSTFGVTNLTIANNTIHWNVETGSYSTVSFNSGIALLSSGTAGTLTNASISGNVIDNTAANGILFAISGAASGISIANNTIRNAGQRTSLPGDFRSGILLNGAPAWVGSSVTNNLIVDTQATATMQRGLEWAGVASDGAGTQVRVTGNQVRFTGTPTKYYQIQGSSPFFNVDVPGYAANSALLGFASLSTGNEPPRYSTITDSLSGRVWHNHNTYSDTQSFFVSQELRDTIPTTGAYTQGDIVWSADSAIAGFAGWVNVSSGSPGTFAKIPLTNAGSNSAFTAAVNGPSFQVTGGAAAVYRCATAGTLPIGALTTVSGNCGSVTAVGLTVQ